MLKVSFDGDTESCTSGSCCRAPAATAPSSCCAPTRTGGRCCSSGCTPSEDLAELWDVEACEIVAGLYARLHVPALPQLRRLTSYVERWLDDLAGGLPARRTDPAPAGASRPCRWAVTSSPTTASDGTDDPRRPALRERAGRATASRGW